MPTGIQAPACMHFKNLHLILPFQTEKSSDYTHRHFMFTSEVLL